MRQPASPRGRPSAIYTIHHAAGKALTDAAGLENAAAQAEAEPMPGVQKTVKLDS